MGVSLSEIQKLQEDCSTVGSETDIYVSKETLRAILSEFLLLRRQVVGKSSTIADPKLETRVKFLEDYVTKSDQNLKSIFGDIFNRLQQLEGGSWSMIVTPQGDSNAR